MPLQALLVNGRGFYGDCALIGGLGDVAGQAKAPTTCNVTAYTVAGGAALLAITCCWHHIQDQIYMGQSWQT